MFDYILLFLNENSGFKGDSDSLLEGDDYFSIRGELIFTKPEEKDVVIKIRQKPRNQQKKALPFKLNLKGEIPINYLKHFISLDVRRIDYQLLVEDFQIIGPISQQKINLLKEYKFFNKFLQKNSTCV